MEFTLENINQYENKTGIYKINLNDHIYIGSSKNLCKRLKYHFYSLKKGIHFNPILQNCYDKYKDICEFEIIEYCDIEVLLKRESHYILKYDADINIIKDPCNIVWTPENTKKLSDSLKEHYKYNDSKSNKPIYMYSLNGEFITEYKSVSFASRIHNVSNSGLGAAARKESYSTGFLWSYNKKCNLPKSNKNYTKIYQLDINKKPIKIWNSVYEAAYYLKLDHNLIKAAIKNKYIYSGYYWKIKYKSIRKPKEEYINNGKEVHQYDLNGNYLNSYKSVNEASRQTGVYNHAICSNAAKIKSYNKSAGGFQWSYIKVDKMPKYENNSSKAKIKQVTIFNIISGEEKSFDSIADAVKEINGIYDDSIAACISAISNKGGFYKYYMAKKNEYIIPNRNSQIYCLSNNVIYSNAKEASKNTNINIYWIKKYCKDKNNNEWLYLADCARQKLRESGKPFIDKGNPNPS